MNDAPKLTIAFDDYQKISALLSFAKPEIADLLEEELARAKIVPASILPQYFVTMNSKVTFVDLDTNKISKVSLVYPHESNIEENKISILAPMGAALIGLKLGQTIEWPVSKDHVRRIKVIGVSTP